VEDAKNQFKSVVDKDYTKVVREITKSHLKDSEWKFGPNQTPLNDFVGPLISEHVDSLHLRYRDASSVNTMTAQILRRTVTPNTVQDHIEEID
jgi:hypothetical protein